MDERKTKIRPIKKSLFFAFAVVFSFVCFLYISKAQTLSPPYFSLETSTNTYYIGETFTAKIKIHTNNTDTNAADAIINYNPEDLEVLNLSEGTVYESYPGKEVDAVAGTIKLTGYSSNQPYNSGNSSATFGIIQFKVLRESSLSTVSFDFTLGDTTDSNIVDTNNIDILNDVLNGNYLLKQDSDNPYVGFLDPALNENNVNVDKNLVLHIKDDGIGVDISTVEIEVNGVVYTSNGVNRFSYSGSDNDYTITINPAENFDYGETVNVSVEASDLASPVNKMETYSYSFTTEEDTTPPVTYNHQPAENESSIPADSNVSFRIKDETRAGVKGVGIDISTLKVEVDGVTYTQGGANSFSYSGDSFDYLITIDPVEDFDEFKLIEVVISGGADINGNVMEEKSYSFSINDVSPPYTADYVPAKGKIDIDLNSDISFHILDSNTGVDINSVIVSVEGIKYSTSQNSSHFSYQGSPSDYLITIDPIEEFKVNDLVVVTIEGADLAALPNNMEMVAYAIIQLKCPIE